MHEVGFRKFQLFMKQICTGFFTAKSDFYDQQFYTK